MTAWGHSEFGALLRQHRRRCGLSQQALAERAGLSVDAIAALERGRRRSPRAFTVAALADALLLDSSDRAALLAASAPEEPVAAGSTLPRSPGGLVGRESELAGLVAALGPDGPRVISLVGPGGVGKSRLAVEAAHAVADQFPDGVRWLTLMSVSRPGGVAAVLAHALDVDRSPGLGGVEALRAGVGDRRQLVVLDNCEHVLAECAEAIEALLAGGRHVRVLATSRERVSVAGERSIPVAPLALPAPPPQLSAIVDAPAARLFLDRVRDINPDLVVGPADAIRIAAICRLLDGLPLALELAAARTAVLSLAELLTGLQDSLSVLGAAPRDAPAHHASLEAAIEWSVGALDDSERDVLAVLATFVGGASRDAVAAVSDRGALDRLDALVTKSVVARRTVGTHSRYGLLRTIRRYVLEHYASAVDAARPAHARWARTYAEAGAPAAGRTPEDTWLTRMDAEAENLRAATSWALGSPDQGVRRIGVALAAALWPWCQVRGEYDEGRAWAEEALSVPGIAAIDRARVLSGAAVFAFLQCDYPLARTRVQETLTAFTSLGDRLGIAWAMERLGSIERERGEYDTAAQHHEAARDIYSALGDVVGAGRAVSYESFVAWLRGDYAAAVDLAAESLRRLGAVDDLEGVSWALISRGAAASYLGDLDGAESTLDAAHQMSERVGYREGVAWSLDQLGNVARRRGRLEHALELLTASHDLHEALGDRWRLASVLDALAAVVVASGDARGAARMLAAADAIRTKIGVPVPPCDQADRAATEEAVRGALGRAEYEAAPWTDLTA